MDQNQKQQSAKRDSSQSDDAAHESEDGFRESFEKSPDAIFIEDERGYLLDVNPAACRLHETERSELLGKHVLDLFPPDKRSEVAASFPKLISGELTQIDGYCLTKNHQAVPVEIRINRIHYLGRPALLLHVRDAGERIRTENALKEAADRLNEAQAIAQLGSFHWDVIGDSIIWSDELYRIYGLDPRIPITLADYFERIHPDDRDRVLTAIEHVRVTRALHEHDYRIVRPNGEERHLHARIACVVEETGDLVALQGTCQDVTNRARSEYEAANARRTLQTVLDNIPQGVFWKDRQSRYLGCNRVVARAFGLESPEAMIGKDDHHLPGVTAEQAAAFITDDREVMETDRSKLNIIEPVTLADGTDVWLETNKIPMHDANGNVVGILGTWRDITARRRAEEQLRETQSWLELAQSAAKFGTWDWDIRANRARCSSEYFRLYGLPPSDEMQSYEDWLSRIHPHDRDRCKAELENALNDGSPYDTEYRVIWPDGSVHWLISKAQVEFAGDGRPIRMTGAQMDVTERRQAEEESQAIQRKMQHAQKLESLGVLAGGIAHDFNNLLTAVLGYAGLARSDLPDQSEAAAMLVQIENAATRAAELTQQMLAYSGRGKFIVKPHRLDLLVREMAALVNSVVSKKAEIVLQLQPAPIIADGEQIRQIVLNLITNASDALGDDVGVIRVSTGVREVDAGTLSSQFFESDATDGKFAFVAVQDNGCGMSDNTLSRIFDPFFTTKFTGRGLGLAAVLGIIRGHHGSIRVESEPGRGTLFEVLLPVLESDGGRAERPTSTTTSKKAKGNILMIEDDPCIRNLVKHVLKKAGCQVREAGDGEEGLRIFAEHAQDIDAVLLDLTMPRMDGQESLRHLRSLNPEVPVLVMSGYTEAEVSARLAGVGASGFIQKPFSPDKLIEQLHKLLSTESRSGKKS